MENFLLSYLMLYCSGGQPFLVHGTPRLLVTSIQNTVHSTSKKMYCTLTCRSIPVDHACRIELFEILNVNFSTAKLIFVEMLK